MAEIIKKKKGKPGRPRTRDPKQPKIHWKKKNFEKADKGITKIGVTRLFHANYNAIEKVIINRGGARSSKTYSIAQVLIHRFFNNPGIKILICRKSLPALKRSNYRTMIEIVDSYGIKNKIEENKTSMTWEFNGSLIQFVSVDNEEKIKSTEWNIIWMEEANEFSFHEYITLLTRMSGRVVPGVRNQMFISLNPMDEHCWIKRKLLDQHFPDILEIHSSWKDNSYLDEDYIKIFETLEQQDPNYYRIYALGEWGKLDNLIYNNWFQNDNYPKTDQICFGLDFGYNVPSCLMEVRWWKEQLWVRQRIYEARLTNQMLIKKLHQELTEEEVRNCIIYADNAEPAYIEEISTAGFNCEPSNKEVSAGIDWCKAFTINVHPDSDDVMKEIRGYSWISDKDGHVQDKPIKFNDHAMDAFRYGAYSHWGQMGMGRPRIRLIGSGSRWDY